MQSLIFLPTIGYNNLPPLLTRWLKSRRTPSPNVVLGPKDSFLAWDSGDCVHSGVPHNLMNNINLVNPHADWMPGKPRIVTLGVAGSYILITKESTFVGKFVSAYPSLYFLLLGLGDESSIEDPLTRWNFIWRRVKVCLGHILSQYAPS